MKEKYMIQGSQESALCKSHCLNIEFSLLKQICNVNSSLNTVTTFRTGNNRPSREIASRFAEIGQQLGRPLIEHHYQDMKKH